MCGFMKDRTPAPPARRNLPAAINFKPVADLISGVEVVNVKHNGSDRHELRKLPRLAHEQVIQDLAANLMQNTMTNLNQLAQFNPTALVNYQPIIAGLGALDGESVQHLSTIRGYQNIGQDVQNYKNMAQANLNREFQAVNQQAERDIANSRMGRSTDAVEMRNSIANQQAIAMQQADMDATMYGEDLADRRLQTDTHRFGLGEQIRGQRRDTLMQGYNLQQQEQEDIRKLRQDEVDLYGVGNQIVQQDFQNSMASPAVGMQSNIYNQEVGQSMQRYGAELQADQADYAMRLQAHNAKPVSFGNMALRTIGNFGTRAANNFIDGRFGIPNNRYGRRR